MARPEASATSWADCSAAASAEAAAAISKNPARSSGKGLLLYGLAAIAVVILLGIAVAALALAFGARRITEQVVDEAQSQAEAARDVEVDACNTDGDGAMSVTLRVTNQSSETSDYAIAVSFELPNRGGPLATARAHVTDLAPGRTTDVEASSDKPPPGEFTCRVSDVERLTGED